MTPSPAPGQGGHQEGRIGLATRQTMSTQPRLVDQPRYQRQSSCASLARDRTERGQRSGRPTSCIGSGGAAPGHPPPGAAQHAPGERLRSVESQVEVGSRRRAPSISVRETRPRPPRASVRARTWAAARRRRSTRIRSFSVTTEPCGQGRAFHRDSSRSQPLRRQASSDLDIGLRQPSTVSHGGIPRAAIGLAGNGGTVRAWQAGAA